MAFVDSEVVENPALSDGIKQAPSQANLRKIRNAAHTNIANAEVLEEIPLFEKGEVHASGVSLNELVTNRLSVYGRYRFTASTNTTDLYHGNEIPYLPRHSMVLGSTLVLPHRLSIQAQGVYRSLRYHDEHNVEPIQADWDAALHFYWEVPSKHWSIETGVDDLLSKEWDTSYFFNFKARF